MFITYKGNNLQYYEIEVRLPKQKKVCKKKRIKLKKKYIPPKDHPWRKLNRIVVAENNKYSQRVNEK